MKRDTFSGRRALPLFPLLVIFSLLAGCTLPASLGGVSVWIDVPLDGLTFPDVQAIKIEGHAASPGSVSRVEIWVNGALLTTIDDPPTEGGLTAFHIEWTPPARGEYTIQAVAFGADGSASAPDSARITFGEAVTPTIVSGCPSPVGGGPTPVNCGEPIGSGCPSPVGGGPTPVSCVTPVVSVTPVITDTPTPLAGAIIQFWADPAEIPAGACVNIRWHVENVRRVVFGGIDQSFDGSYGDCLCASQRYTLTVTHLDGSEERRTVDIAVSGSCDTPTPPPPSDTITDTPPPPPPPPSDTTPPPAPTPAVPADGLSIACEGSQSLAWLPVDDPSGIAEYQVQVQRSPDNTNWQKVSGSPFGGIHDKQMSLSVECAWYYRWRVRAVDGAGNVGGWSGWSYFAVTLG